MGGSMAKFPAYCLGVAVAALLCSTLLCAGELRAGDVRYVAEHRDLSSGTTDFEVTITSSRHRVRTDVISGDHISVSLIESNDRAELVDYSSGVAVFVDKHPADGDSVRWHATHRQQFALGGYCDVMKDSDPASTELCVVPATAVFSTELTDRNANFFIGNFLAIVNSAAGDDELFPRALAALRSPAQPDIPLIVRNAPGTKNAYELRFRHDRNGNFDANEPPLPDHLHRISLDEAEQEFTRTARR